MRHIVFAINEAPGASRNHKGYFHQWGTCIVMQQSQPCVVTKAVVEDGVTGVCYVVYPHQIKFIEGVIDVVHRDVYDIVSASSVGQINKVRLVRDLNTYFNEVKSGNAVG